MIIEETEITEVEEKDQGFTLVELLIVIVILGILATIVVFAVRGITDKGQENACKATAKTYEVAIEAYYAQEGTENHPVGDDLVTFGFIRTYDDDKVEVVQGVDTGAVTDTSTVRATAGAECVGLI